ncbi:hypothetical protein CBR_g3290 [Chara braunii]|uniref:Dynein axonemal intermediate chain 4 n=1 Tax=Chara braunii TaxID=69332 RepID=A0A388KFB8_CHABU|nr:hypothetical protein CBR_g3290 [Chara braunii]|eukprot:GBG68748.1 hypothetical protein CBR_g3290 [Chara braunii]
MVNMPPIKALSSARSSIRSIRPDIGKQPSYKPGARRNSNSSQSSARFRGTRVSRQSHLRRKAKPEPFEQEAIQVFDDAGKDVTPKPMSSTVHPTVLHEKLFSPPSPGGQSSEGSEASMERISVFGRSMYSMGSSRGSLTPDQTAEDDSASQGEDMEGGRRSSLSSSMWSRKLAASSDIGSVQGMDTIAVGGGAGAAMASSAAVAAPADTTAWEELPIFSMSHIPSPRSERDLQRSISLTLRETDTFFLLDIVGICYSTEDQDTAEVTARNQQYLQRKENRSAETLTEEGVQTVDLIRKTKEVQLPTVTYASIGSQSTRWDITDSIHLMHEQEEAEERRGLVEQARGGDGGQQSSSKRVSVMGRGEGGGEIGGVQQGPGRGGGFGGGGAESGGTENQPGTAKGTEPPSRVISRRGSFSVEGSFTGLPPPSSDGTMPDDRLSLINDGGIDSLLNAAEGAEGAAAATASTVSVTQLRGLPGALEMLEHALMQNIYHEKLLIYRDFRLGTFDAEDAADLHTPRSSPPYPSLGSAHSKQRPDSANPPQSSPASPQSDQTSPRAAAAGGDATTRSSHSTTTAAAAATAAAERGEGTNPAATRQSSMVVAPSTTSGSVAGPSAAPATKTGSAGGRVSSLSSSSSPSLTLLWDFRCDVTEGRNVSSITWNRMHKDILAVGYGEFDYAAQKDGLIAFWSLKNPRYPHWVIPCSSGVTAVDFSAANPNLLAVGFYDGKVAVYDVRSSRRKGRQIAGAIVETGHVSGKHSDPVWKVKWVDRGAERGEVLVSASTDGRITEWSIKKGLEFTDLMKLKRVVNRARSRAGVHSKTEAFISRRASGMSIDFSSRDPSIYVTGTEEGVLHKCSCSYSEQYLKTYFGHTGPVYQAQWSPFDPSVFLTCSDDWTIRIWKEEDSNALLVLQSGNDSVEDVHWSPNDSTIFGAVTADGRVEIWDLAVSTLKPFLTATLENVRLTSILFSESSPIVVVGRFDGGVSVFRLAGQIGRPGLSLQMQQKQLEEAMTANIIKM